MMSLNEELIQIRELTLASMKSRYRKTWAGFIWVILNPLLMFGVQSLVFKKFLKLDIPDYFLFLLGGLLPWIFLTTTIQMGTPVFVTQSQLLRSFKINPMVILASQVLDGFINFVASFILILLPLYLLSDKSFTNLLFLPLALIPLFLGSLGLTITLSILNVFYRDLNFVMGFFFNLLFFLTPVFYPKEFVPNDYQWMINANPAVYLIEPFRTVIYQNDVGLFFISFLKGMAVALGLISLSFYTWKRRRNEFYRIL
jgi:ABC-type polysaccharide/polyol phosphate export permease